MTKQKEKAPCPHGIVSKPEWTKDGKHVRFYCFDCDSEGVAQVRWDAIVWDA